MPECTRGLSYVIAREFRRFEIHVLRVVRNAAVQAAHNPCERNGLVAVANHQVFGAKGEFLFIERDNFFAYRRTAYDNLLACNIIRIKCVHRLADFQEYEIRDINDDGIIEIPVQQNVPSVASTLINEKLYLTNWCSFNGDKLTVEMTAMINSVDGYY